MGEDGKLHRVELRAHCAVGVGANRHAHVTPFCQTGLTARLHQDGAEEEIQNDSSATPTKWNETQYERSVLSNKSHAYI